MKTWPIYVINLDHAKSRLAKFDERMNALGLPYRRFAATDTKDLSAATIAQSVCNNQKSISKWPMTNSEVACYLSHIALWEKIGDGKSPGAFILEDDAELTRDAPEMMKIISTNPLDWDMLKLFSQKPKTLVQSRALSDGYAYGVPNKHPYSTIAYAITQKAAAAMAKNYIPFSLPIDMDLKHWWNHEACIKLVQPNLCNPETSHRTSSSIEKDRNIARTGGALQHFVQNALYQLQFKTASFRHRGKQPLKPRW